MDQNGNVLFVRDSDNFQAHEGVWNREILCVVSMDFQTNDNSRGVNEAPAKGTGGITLTVR